MVGECFNPIIFFHFDKEESDCPGARLDFIRTIDQLNLESSRQTSPFFSLYICIQQINTVIYGLSCIEKLLVLLTYFRKGFSVFLRLGSKE